MHPVLLQTNYITLNSYPVFLVLAALTLVGAASALASRQGIPRVKSLPHCPCCC